MKQAVENLVRELDKRPWMLHADHVCIEGQLSRNRDMHTLSHCIQVYFITRSLKTPNSLSAFSSTPENDITQTEDGTKVKTIVRKPPTVHFISPRSKFTVADVPEPNKVSGHARNKKVAVLMAQKILLEQKDNTAYDYLMSHRKKDDLSDSFLQGLYFLRLMDRKNKTSKKILDHLNGAKREIEIVDDDTVDEMGSKSQTRVYKSGNYVLPLFNVDSESVNVPKSFKSKSRA